MQRHRFTFKRFLIFCNAKVALFWVLLSRNTLPVLWNAPGYKRLGRAWLAEKAPKQPGRQNNHKPNIERAKQVASPFSSINQSLLEQMRLFAQI